MTSLNIALFTLQNMVTYVYHTNNTWLLASWFWVLKFYRIQRLCFMAVLALYLHSFLELDHERELGEDGQISLFRHGQLRRL